MFFNHNTRPLHTGGDSVQYHPKRDVIYAPKTKEIIWIIAANKNGKKINKKLLCLKPNDKTGLEAVCRQENPVKQLTY